MKQSEYTALEDQREEMHHESCSVEFNEESAEYQRSILEQIESISDKLDAVDELDYEEA